MNRQLLFSLTGLFALLTAAACSGNGNNGTPDAGGTDADIDPFEDPVIRVSGTAEVHPSAKAWLEGNSQPLPSLEGLTLRVQEPLRVALNDPGAVFGSVTLGADAAFAVDGVDTARVNTGIAAGVLDERMGPNPVVVRTSTAIWDVQLRQGKPELDISDARAWALPTEFHDQLTVSIGEAAIQAVTGDSTKVTLIDAGFMLGRVVDAEGNPVAGAVIGGISHVVMTWLASGFAAPRADVATALELFLISVAGGTVTAPE